MDDRSTVELLGRLAAPVITALVLGWVLRSARQPVAKSPDGTRILRYPRSLLYLGWGFLLFFGGAGIAGYVAAHGSEFRKEFIVASLVCGGLSGLPILGICYRCSISYTEHEVRNVPLWGKPFAFSWSDVKQVIFSATSLWWVLKLRSGESVRVSLYMNGAVEFMNALSSKNPVIIPDGVTQSGRKIEIGNGRS